jgi:hypothetical protein
MNIWFAIECVGDTTAYADFLELFTFRVGLTVKSIERNGVPQIAAYYGTEMTPFQDVVEKDLEVQV